MNIIKDKLVYVLLVLFAMNALMANPVGGLIGRVTGVENGVKDINATKPPIGSIIAWHRNQEQKAERLENLQLPKGWVLCDGAEIKEGIFKGTKSPNLNSEKYADERGLYLRGSDTSGKYNESTCWTTTKGDKRHIEAPDTAGRDKARYGLLQASLIDIDIKGGATKRTYSDPDPGGHLDESRRFQVAAMTVVWIMRVK